MKITVLNESDMRSVFSMQEAIQADKDALAAYSSGNVNIPLRANLDVPEHNGQSLYMYGYVPAVGALGVKMVSIFTDNYKHGLPNVPATMVLLDSTTGLVSALLDGTYLTRVRTGAVAGAATDELARKDSEVFALIGSGGQAETQLEAVLAVRNIKLVKICSGHFERAQAFAQKMSSQFSEKYGTRIIAVPTPAEAVCDADIVTAVTTAKSPVFDGTLLKAGAHVNGVGSYTPDMIEVPESVVLGAGKLYVDTMDAVAEAGDFRSLIDKGVFNESMVTGELGDLINGKTKGRESDGELTFFKTTGNAVLDLVTAQRIYLRAIEQGIGRTIEM